MKLIPLLKTCIKALIRNPMRSSLTVLGIIIGIAAVIALMEIGRGSTEQIKKTIASMGANTMNIYPEAVTTNGVRSGAGGYMSLTPADSEAIARECPSVLRASPVMRIREQVVYGNLNWRPNRIQGGNVDYLKIRDWYEMESGEPYSDEDVLYGKRVCLIGQTVLKEVFGGRSPIGEELRIKDVMFQVIGVLPKKGASMSGWDQDDTVLIPWTSIRYRLQGLGGEPFRDTVSETASAASKIDRSSVYASTGVDYYAPTSDLPYENGPHPRRFDTIEYIMVELVDPEQSKVAIEEITSVLRQRHRLMTGDPNDFSFRDMAEITGVYSSTSESMTQLLLIVAMISLVVGGVGIMNIMMVSVTERTREIGLRMAVGVRGGDIMRQFLFEAILLCLIGGAIGMLVGRVGSIVVSKSVGWPTVVVPEAMVLAVGVSAVIGIIFGWYPAWKASRLDPIDALRYE